MVRPSSREHSLHFKLTIVTVAEGHHPSSLHTTLAKVLVTRLINQSVRAFEDGYPSLVSGVLSHKRADHSDNSSDRLGSPAGMNPAHRSKHRHVRSDNTAGNSAAPHTSSSLTAERSSRPQQGTPKPSVPARFGSSGHVPSELAPPWPFNPQETALIRSGYIPAFKPKVLAAQEDPASETDSKKNKRQNRNNPSSMAEPRARAARHKGQMNFASERT